MSELTISTIAMVLCLAPALLHFYEVGSPLLSRWIVNYVLPFFEPGVPKKSQSLTSAEQLTMLDAAVAAAPPEKKSSASDYIFLALFEQRQNALAFIGVLVGVVYGFTLTLPERNPIHLILAVIAVLLMLVNLNHAGFRFLGNHPRVSRHGRNVGIVFAPFWALAAALNVLAFSWSLPG